MQEKFLSVADVAADLGVSPRRVQQLLSAGRIQGAIRVGGDTRRAVWLIPAGPDGHAVIIDLPQAPGPKPRWRKP